MATILWHTVRQRLLRPLPLALCLGTVVASVVASLWTTEEVSGPMGAAFLPLLAVVLAAGLIGRDVENGSMHLLLARPLTRSQLLAGRVFGVLVVLLATGLAGWALSAGGAWLRGGDVDWATSSATMAEHFLRASWWVALLVAGSVALSGYRDVALFFGAFLVAELLSAIGENTGLRWFLRAGLWLFRELTFAPHLESWSLGNSAARQLLHYASNVTLALAFAFWYFNRREMGYGRE